MMVAMRIRMVTMIEVKVHAYLGHSQKLIKTVMFVFGCEFRFEVLRAFEIAVNSDNVFMIPTMFNLV